MTIFSILVTIYWDSKLKVSEQCGIIANGILGLIRRNVVHKEEIIILLYKSIVRLSLEYILQVWRPYLDKDIAILEKIQRRANKMKTALRQLSLEDRLKQPKLTTLETAWF